nr:hypothetical protein [uncultured Albidiferax sp.]
MNTTSSLIFLQWPQALWLVWMLLQLGVAIARNGEPFAGKHSWHAKLGYIVLMATLLWHGGFFSPAAR